MGGHRLTHDRPGPAGQPAIDDAGPHPDPLPWPSRLRSLPSWLVGKTSSHAHRVTTEAFAAISARKYHYALLASLAEFGPSSQADLGRRCSFDRSDVAILVNELLEAGYVERTQDPADRRRNIVALTPAGRERLAEFDRVAAGIQERLLGPLGADERAELVRLLTRVLDHLGGVVH
ncbi:MAG: winged helix-turn-helix transcriptional regulator [Frankia sp.]|nr:winged helix-turn-helix transcriptional regulator [Frankia sp.]